MVAHPKVLEAAAIGIPDELKGEALWVFVVLAPGEAGDDDLRAEISKCVTDALGPSFKPAAGSIHDRTTENPQRARCFAARFVPIVTGDAPGDMSGLEDPATLEAIAASA